MNSSFPVVSARQLVAAPYEPPSFLVDGLIPQRQLVLLSAESGSNKTSFMLHACAALTSRSTVAGKFDTHWDGRNILYLNGELSQQLINCYVRSAYAPFGPEPSECLLFAGARGISNLQLYEAGSLNLHPLSKGLANTKPCLVIIDTFREFTGMLDANDSASVRYFLSGLSRLIEEYDCSIVVTHHLRKRGVYNSAKERIAGSGEFVNAPDVVIGLSGQPAKKLTILKTRTPTQGYGVNTEFTLRSTLELQENDVPRSRFQVIDQVLPQSKARAAEEQIITSLQGGPRTALALSAQRGTMADALRRLVLDNQVREAKRPSGGPMARGRPSKHYELCSPSIQGAT